MLTAESIDCDMSFALAECRRGLGESQQQKVDWDGHADGHCSLDDEQVSVAPVRDQCQRSA